MDKRVFIVAIAFLVIAGGIIIYNVFSGNCDPYTISWTPESPRIGEEVTFKSNSENDESMNWVFDDQAPVTQIETKFIFNVDGIHKVRAFHSETCLCDTVITILPKRIVETVKPAILVPNSITAGEYVTFTDNTPGADNRKWSIPSIGESGTGDEFKVVFSRPGNYELIVETKGEYVIGYDTLEISVKKATKAPVAKREPYVPAPKPERPKVEKPKVEKPKPPVEAPPNVALKSYDDDATFAKNFISIANLLATDENSSIGWSNSIVSQTGTAGTMKVIMKSSAGDVREIKLESFKNQMLSSSVPREILKVSNIQRRKDGSISQITISVSKI